MNFKLVTLDARYRGSNRFKYRLEFSHNYAPRNGTIRDFQTMLEWLWDSYGPGCDRDHYRYLLENMQLNNETDLEEKGPQWSWHINQKEEVSFLYIRTNEILSHIKLKWT